MSQFVSWLIYCILTSIHVDNATLTYINGYPFIQVLAESYNVQYQVNWMTFKDDKMINIVCVSLKENFVDVFPFYNKLKESIILK